MIHRLCIGTRTRISAPMFVALLSCLTLLTVTAPAAHGATARDFDPGRIIDDTVFYNAGSMNASQIQTFLNAKVPNCDTNGTQSAADWGYPNLTHAQLAERFRNGSHGFTKDTGFHAPPYTCLKNFKQNTPQMEAASGLCGALTSRTNRTAAQIINDVAKACDINPQVLIVLLQKEMSLVTDNWPLNRQYRNATGFACPDTAPCDPKFNGFFYQVYHAARQFKVYKAYPTTYNYIAGRTNRIYWHPDLSRCGSSQVYIQNQATAALYIYTPYRPNQAALNNLYGTGNSCSSYGNRNFWRLFTDWFGSTKFSVKGSIGSLYNSASNASLLGLPIENEARVSSDGWKQCFENGCIAGSGSTGYYMVKGSIGSHYKNSPHNLAQALGIPIGAESSLDNGWYQPFQNGYIAGRSSTGYWAVKGSISKSYSPLRDMAVLGMPIAIENSLGNGTWEQAFDNGFIIGSSSTGYWVSKGGIREHWRSNGGISSRLGLPMSPIHQTNNGLSWQEYKNGMISSSSSADYYDVKGSIYAAYISIGGINGNLKEPLSAEQSMSNGVYQQRFKNGYIVGEKGLYFESSGPIRNYWETRGLWGGRMGQVAGPIKGGAPNATWQYYKNGVIIVNPKNNQAWESKGSIRAQWAKLGYQNGSLGYPTGPEVYSNGEYSQTYEYGIIKSRSGKTSYTIY